MTVRAPYLLLFLVFLTLAVYYPTLFAPLNSLDDQVYVNRLLNEEGFSLSRHFRPQGAPEYYRPLLTLTFELDKHVGGLQEPFMHLVNILVHALNVLLIYLLGRQLGRFIDRESLWLPFFAAMLYAVHPLNSEAVNWIAGRTDLLAGTFAFAALCCLLQALLRNQLGWGLVAVPLMLAGALCKETALFVLPGALFLLLCRNGRPASVSLGLRQRLTIFSGLSLAAVVYLLLRSWGMQVDRGLSKAAGLAASLAGSTPGHPPPTSPDQLATIFEAAGVALKVTGFYAVKLVQPFPLNFAIHRVPDAYMPVGLVVVCLLVLMAWRRRPLGVFYLMSAAFATPALLLVFTGVAWTAVAERYMYLPAGPFLLATVFGLAGLSKSVGGRRAWVTLYAAVLVMAVVATVQRNFVWQENLTLYQDTVEKSPDFAPARYELAKALADHGRQEEADAILMATPGVKGQSSSLNRAGALVRSGEIEAARAFLHEQIVLRDGREFHALEMLISVNERLLQSKDNPTSQRENYLDMRDALLRLQELSRNPFYWYRLGRVNLWLGEKEEARRCFLEAARLLPPGSPYVAPARKLAEDLAR
jgi:tetratricopeptide (TPR) repeat protein